MTAHYELHTDVAVLTLDHPPVNAMNLDTRRALAAGLARALADPDIAAIVIRGAGSGFSGGADIREFGSEAMLAEPNLHDLIDALEHSPKPVVMALHGVCFGGGLELALAAHARVAARGSMLALPEVKIGLVPGAGGTQRLPRAIGLASALQMIVSGDPQPVQALMVIPGQVLLAAIGDGDPLVAALRQARELAAGGQRPLLRARTVVADAESDARIAAVRASLPAGYPAPARCVDCVVASATLPFAVGMALERAAFAELLDGPESKALRHAFFAERAAGRIDDLPADTKARELRRIGVVGAGTMGSGIAMCLLNAGYPVVLVETNQAALERGCGAIDSSYQSSVRKQKLSPEQCAQRMARLHATLEWSELADCDLIIEAVYEDYAVKHEVFGRLDALAKPGAILASNTSTLDLNRIAAGTGRPQDVLGLHFFSPAHIMRLLEVVRGRESAADVLVTAMALARRIGKTAVVSGVCDGFIGNRMIEQYSRQAGFLLEEGALPQQIDAAMEAFGFAMGPFRMSDLAGNDIGWAIRRRRAIESPDLRYPGVFDRLCETGRFGQKTGAGWYDYLPGERSARPSALVNELVIAHSQDQGIPRRAIDDREIVERLIYALVNEGARILEEGIAARASDIDVVYLSGYGFPRYRGGPMHYANRVGLAAVLQAIDGYAAMDPDDRQSGAWVAAPLLVRLAAQGRGFA